MSFFRVLLASLAALLIAAQPADAGRLKIRGGYLTSQTTLNALALSSPNGTAGASGSSAITGATPGSTLTMQNTVGGLYSVDTGARILNWTSGVVAGTDSPVVRETLAGAGNSPRDNTLNVTIASSSYTTGQSIAKSGPAQYPNVLDSASGTQTFGVAVAYRPAWAVAGVDYRVGPSSTQNYTGKTIPGDQANLPACASYNAAIHYVRFDPPCTIDGWLLNGVGLYNNGGTGAVSIKNNKFDNTVGNDVVFYYGQLGNSDDTIEFNEVFPNYYRASIASQFTVGKGNTLIQMNYVHDVAEDVQNMAAGGVASMHYRWNLVVNIGADWDIHGDIIQGICNTCASGTNFNGIEEDGNTIIQSPADANHRPGVMNTDIRLGDNPVGVNYVNPKWHHQTTLAFGLGHVGNNAGSPYYNYPAIGNLSQVGDPTTFGNVTNWEIHDNYFFSDATTYTSTDRMVNGIFYQGGHQNTTYTNTATSHFGWDNSLWPTTLP